MPLLPIAPPSLVSISKLDLASVTQEWGNPQKDRSVDNNPLRIGSRSFDSGLGTHASSSMEINLGKAASEFHAWVGVDAEVQKKGSIRFRVIADGAAKFDSGVMRGGQEPKEVRVDLTGVKTLRLVVDDADDGIDSDHADWADATIATERPKAISAVKLQMAPPPKLAPVDRVRTAINGAEIVGGTPGKPFIWRIPASGRRPIAFSVENLPDTLRLDASTGVISGTVPPKGNYKIKLMASGPGGKATRDLRLVADKDKLALTPPMGWNSWNAWGLGVNAARVRAAADSFISTGLADFGYNFVNIDDAWELTRNAEGEMLTNRKFPDMAALTKYVHDRGLRVGIYSSPGPYTCGGYEGSYQHEAQDVKTYNEWGIDYLKYDWCSYGGIAKNGSLEELKKPYSLMGDLLKAGNRDIVYSLCQYGMGDVYNWGESVGGDLWRTTGDITDTWSSMAGIGFSHSPKAVPTVGPSAWNDPDMLVVGYLGWGENQHLTRLTPHEQVTHISLWSLLAAPLLIGCDLTRIDDFTSRLLMNPEVIAIDQDPLGRPAKKMLADGDVEIWSRPLEDGSYAVGVFNRGLTKTTQKVTWSFVANGETVAPMRVRDVWTRKDASKAQVGEVELAPHGAQLYRVWLR